MKMLKYAIEFLKDIMRSKSQIYELIKRDFKQRYVGSSLGFLWTILEPLCFLLIIWFVFSFGLKIRPQGNVPFIIYLIPALVVYNFFNQAVGTSCNIFRSYSFLVQKVQFRVSLVPVARVISELGLHFIFIIIVMMFLIAYGIWPTLYWFQALYYLFGTLMLIIGLSWLLSSLGVFVRDMAPMVAIFLRFLFYLTPIFWSIEVVPARYQIFLKINPLFYIVQGYRQSFVYGVPFWHDPLNAFYFWGVVFTIFIIGILVFIKLRPHFADVL